ncbi:MAG: SH3 domain-containing protein, partial [Candidatus Omnitrophica bacterium]|nr:SH3 domain-containing protein [Candidatus Omnitrophota bacterium]
MNLTKLFVIILTVSLTGIVTTAAVAEKLYYVAPTELPNVSPDMQTAGYWIARMDQPDTLLMDRDGISRFNRRVRDELGLTTGLLQVPAIYNGRILREELRGRWEKVKAGQYYRGDDRKAGSEYFERMMTRMGLDQISDEIVVSYGVIVRYADQRYFPTDEGLYAVAGDIDFDELQNSALDIGTPVLVLHGSADRQWSYVLSELSAGWVRAEHVALCGHDDFKIFVTVPSPIVVTAAKGDLFLNKELTEYAGWARMGARFVPVQQEREDLHTVLLPTRRDDGRLLIRTAYLRREHASAGFLPFTPRVIIGQAFKLLNAPYGWGGMHGEQDCSRFLQEVFATVGIRLPRDSGPQAKAGVSLAVFDAQTAGADKLAALNAATPGSAILAMRGHIMLYLGKVSDRPYAIHAFWGYREPTSDGDRVRVVNRVAVSDLFLGEGSKKGSLLDRMRGVVVIWDEGLGTGDQNQEIMDQGSV